uniref:Cohesin domain-containing protein n=1 Tax=Candidatus Methanophaga sp. ANME-1 ERB7 TaxID=2759913 RepID=A0A7G9Z8Z3_9EURY|nr:hypothetical protein HGIILDEE_00016 [Methanosarcinales archaeon ANME-1 ERB7]
MDSKAMNVILVAVIVLSVQLPTSAIPTADHFGVEDTSGYKDTHVLIPVNITNPQNGLIQCIIFNISYTNSVIKVVDVHQGILTSNWEYSTYNNFDWGTWVVVGGSGNPIQNGLSGSVVVLNFSVVGEPGETTKMNLSDIQLSDEDGSLVGTAPAKNGTFTILSSTPALVFDTGAGTYPSISGVHTGTITPNKKITVSKLYTYSCPGTGGHSEYVRIWNESWTIASGNWAGYRHGWQNITFDNSFTLKSGELYNYTLHTGSYPQIIHKKTFPVPEGEITCTKFTDANGKVYHDWIPAIKLFL